MGAKRLVICLLVLATLSANSCPAFAGKKQKAAVPDSTILSDALAGPFQKMEGLDPTMATLLWQLSHKPELMNVEYLKYYLGNPDSQQMGARSRAYYWYDKVRQPRYELYQEDDKPGEVVESSMILHLPPSDDLEFSALEAALGAPVRSYFDQTGSPTQMYCFAANTTLSMHSPPNSFRVAKSTIAYMGTPLPSPSFEDIQVAHDSFLGRSQFANAAITKAANPTEALELARNRVAEHPADADAHIALAQALKRKGSVYEAIGEYKRAMSLNKYNDSVQQQCVQGLKDLYVLPADYGADGNTGVATKRKLEFSHSGQRMRVADTTTPVTE